MITFVDPNKTKGRRHYVKSSTFQHYLYFILLIFAFIVTWSVLVPRRHFWYSPTERMCGVCGCTFSDDMITSFLLPPPPSSFSCTVNLYCRNTSCQSLTSINENAVCFVWVNKRCLFLSCEGGLMQIREITCSAETAVITAPWCRRVRKQFYDSQHVQQRVTLSFRIHKGNNYLLLWFHVICTLTRVPLTWYEQIYENKKERDCDL